MTKQEYQTKLDAILNTFRDNLQADEGLALPKGELTWQDQALQAICLLNEEAIGADPAINFDDYKDNVELKLEHRKLRKELKSVIGVSK